MKVNKTKYTMILNAISIIILVGGVVYLIINWKTIPNRIAGHHNVVGEIDRWGSKNELIILPIINILFFILMSAVEHYPNLWNTGVTITEENSERIYRILKNMIVTLKLSVVFFFTYLTIITSMQLKLPSMYLIVIVSVNIFLLAFFLIKLFRNK